MDWVKTEKEVMNTDEVTLGILTERTIKMGDGTKQCLQELKKCGKPKGFSQELYGRISLRTEGEAMMIVSRILRETDGLKAWGLLQANFNQKTLSRLMRLQQESMHPKVAKVGELVGTRLNCE